MTSMSVRKRQGKIVFMDIDEMDFIKEVEKPEMFEEDNQYFPEIMNLDIDTPIVTRDKSTKELGYELAVLGLEKRVTRLKTKQDVSKFIRGVDNMQRGMNNYVVKLERKGDCSAIENIMNLKIRLSDLTEVALAKLEAFKVEQQYLKIIRKISKEFGLTEKYWERFSNQEVGKEIILKVIEHNNK